MRTLAFLLLGALVNGSTQSESDSDDSIGLIPIPAAISREKAIENFKNARSALQYAEHIMSLPTLMRTTYFTRSNGQQSTHVQTADVGAARRDLQAAIDDLWLAGVNPSTIA